MKFSKLAAAGPVMVASAAFAGGKVPPGWMEVADSQAQFSSVQGQDGWTYLFDRGPGTAIADMSYFTSNLGFQAWCTRPVAGGQTAQGGSHCFLHADGGHANSAGDCQTPVPGLERPIRQWTAPASLPVRLLLSGGVSSLSTGLRVELLIDGAVVFANTYSGSGSALFSYTISTMVNEHVRIICDPLGSCHNDGFGTTLVVLTPDCNANLIPDAVEIAAGSVYDRNHDGVPDVCQCLADVIENGIVDGADLAALLTAWGTDGGIYPRADTNADGVVDANDLAVVLGGWGACP